MEIRVKTRKGLIIFCDIDPGMSMDAMIPEEGRKGTRVHVSTHGFREIRQYSNFDSVTTYTNQTEDDMVRVMVHIVYNDTRDYVSLVNQEVPIKTKKVKFKDTASYVIVTKE